MNKRSLLYALAYLLYSSGSEDALAQKKYDPGATDTEIKIGQNAPLSGPASSYAILNRVEAAYVQAVNTQGGINGRKIVLVQRDDGYSPPKTVEVTRQMVEGEEILAMVSPFGSPTNVAIQKYLNAKKVPQLLVQSGVSRWNDPQNFPWSTPYSPFYKTEGQNIAQYLLQTKADARIGVLYQADDIGRDYLSGLRDQLGGKAATMIVKELGYQVTDPTIDSQIIDMKSSGVDVVFLAAQNKFAAQAIRKMHELSWKPLILLPSVANSISGVLIPAGLEASTGVITTTIYKSPGDPTLANDEGLKAYLAFMKQNFPNNNPDDITAITGYSVIEIAVEILRRCGDDLTRENVLKQATNLRGLKVSMVTDGITVQTNPQDYTAFKSMQFSRFDGKNWIKFGGLIGDVAPTSN